MNKMDIRQVQQALVHAMGKVKGVEVSPGSAAAVFVLPFVDRHGQPLRFYAYTRPPAKKIFLTDGGQVLMILQKSGFKQTGHEMALLQAVLRSFDLTVLEDGQVLEQTDRPLWQRVVALVQALMTADGVMRTWTRPEGQA